MYREKGGQIPRRNPDKSLKSFSPRYLQSPRQLCLGFVFLQTHAVSVKEKEGKPFHRTPAIVDRSPR